MTAEQDEAFEAAMEARLRREQQDLESILCLPQGRRMVWVIIERSGVFGASYSPDTHAMAFTEGRRSVGLELMTFIQERLPNRWLEMIGETQSERAGTR